MIRISLITWIMLFVAPAAYSQSDKDLLETVRASVTKIFLEQASWVLPESFRNSGLAPSDKERLVQQLANDTATCIVDSVVEYAALYDVPISDLVSSEGTIHFDGDSGSEFVQLMDFCALIAWQVAGVSRE